MQRIGEVLMEAGLISDTQLAAALGEQARWGNRLGETLVQLGFLPEAALIRLLSDRMGFPGVDLHGRSIHPDVVDIIPAEIAQKYSCLPIVLEKAAGKKLLYVAMEDPSNLTAVDDLTFRTGCVIRACLAGPVQIRRAISLCYDGVDKHGVSVELDLDEPLRMQSAEDPVEDENWVENLERPEEVVEAAPSPVSQEPVPAVADSLPDSSESEEGASGADLPMRQILQVMTRLLIDKGVITRKELMDEVEAVRAKS